MGHIHVTNASIKPVELMKEQQLKRGSHSTAIMCFAIDADGAGYLSLTVLLDAFAMLTCSYSK